MNKVFMEEETQIVFRVMKRCSTSLVIRKIKTMGKKLPKKNLRTPRTERQRFLAESAHQFPAYERQITKQNIQTRVLV